MTDKKRTAPAAERERVLVTVSYTVGGITHRVDRQISRRKLERLETLLRI